MMYPKPVCTKFIWLFLYLPVSPTFLLLVSVFVDDGETLYIDYTHHVFFLVYLELFLL